MCLVKDLKSSWASGTSLHSYWLQSILVGPSMEKIMYTVLESQAVSCPDARQFLLGSKRRCQNFNLLNPTQILYTQSMNRSMRWKFTSARTGSQSAFTLIEVISVLIILGILAAVAIPRMVNTGAEQRVVVDKLKVHLRHAQLRSMNSDQSWGVKCTGNEYFMFRNGDVNDKIRFMGEDQVIVNIPSQVSVSPNFILSFNTWGVPYDGFDPETGLKVGDPGYTISIGDEVVTILPETGFIL